MQVEAPWICPSTSAFCNSGEKPYAQRESNEGEICLNVENNLSLTKNIYYNNEI